MNIETELVAFRERLKSLTDRVEKYDEDQGALLGEIGTIKVDMSSIKTNVGNIEKKLDQALERQWEGNSKVTQVPRSPVPSRPKHSGGLDMKFIGIVGALVVLAQTLAEIAKAALATHH